MTTTARLNLNDIELCGFGWDELLLSTIRHPGIRVGCTDGAYLAEHIFMGLELANPSGFSPITTEGGKKNWKMGVGWLMGLEPTTTGITILDSTN